MTIKRFLKLQIIFVVLFALTIASNTVAWAPRPKVQGGSFMSEGGTNGSGTSAINKDKTYFTAMQLVTPSKGYFINGTSCSAETYLGEINADTGKITYDETTAITDLSGQISYNQTYYFKTVITNSSAVTTNVSLFFSGSFGDSLGTSFRLGVKSPILREIGVPTNSSSSGINYYKFTPIVRAYEVAGNGTVNVEWYLTNIIDKTDNFEITDIILANH